MNRTFYYVLNGIAAVLLFCAAGAADAGSVPMADVLRMVFAAVVLMLFASYRLSKKPRRMQHRRPVPMPAPDGLAA